MSGSRDIVITGIGIVSPIGIGSEPFWEALATGTSGIRPVDLFDASSLKVKFGGQIPDFDPKLYVRPRKSLKVMSREIQLGFAAADPVGRDWNGRSRGQDRQRDAALPPRGKIPPSGRRRG